MVRRGILMCVLAAVLFGSSTPAASVLARDVAPLVLAGLLYLGAALAALPFVVRRRPTVAALRASRGRLALAVLAGGALGPALFIVGLGRVDAATASLLLNLELVATMIIAATVLREHVSIRVLLGAALVTIGGVLLVWDPGAQWSTGALFIVGACVCWGIDNSVTAHIDRVSPETIVVAKGCIAGTVNVVLGLTLQSHGATLPSGWSVIAALAVGAVGYGWSIALWVRGARQLGAARAQLIFAIAPFVGALLAWTVLGDSLAPVQLIAAVLAAVGVVYSLGSGHDHLHRHEAAVHDHEHVHPDDHHEHDHVPEFVGRHSHTHVHAELEHRGDHLPDVHHRHRHR